MELVTPDNRPSIQPRFPGPIGFRLEWAVETVGKLTPLLAGSPTLRGHSWSVIHQETGFAKGTAQQAFHGLRESVVPSIH